MSKSTSTLSPKARLEARLPADLHALLKRAAEIEGRSLSDFVIAAASIAARETIERTAVIRLSREAQRQFVDMLLHPPKPNAAMKRAIARHHDLIGE